MSALSPVLATSSGAPWAHPLTRLDSALTGCCLSYKQNAPISPLESALTNASHLLESTHFETSCFDTLAPLSPVTPLESALTKNTGGWGFPPVFPSFRPPAVPTLLESEEAGLAAGGFAVEVFVGAGSGDAAAGGAVDETDLHEVRLVDFFDGVFFFAEGGGEGAHADGSAAVFVKQGEHEVAVDFV